jgi:outer membrane protein TolC
MSSHELKNLLDQVPDTRELVLRRPRTWSADFDAWREAREETRDAYQTWFAQQTAEAYVVYRAAQDREDAAQDTLARA